MRAPASSPTPPTRPPGWVAEADRSADRAIAEPSGPDVTFGLAEHVASESMGRHRGYWWAPDGTRLLVARVDTAAVERWYISEPAEPAQPPRAVRYPVAGTANAEVTLWIIGLDGARTQVQWDIGAFEYAPAAGWSLGGSLAALAVLRRPDVFHAAVAGAAPSDMRLYDTHWRERFYGHPDRYPERYEANSLVHEAPNLTRPLLLIHGLADDTVFPANMLRPSAALLAAGRPHEVLPLTGATHRVSDETADENLLWHEVHFFRRHLG